MQGERGRIDFQAIAQDALSDALGFLTRLYPAGRVNGREYEVGDINGNPGNSLKINMTTGRWADFAANLSGGDLISLYASAHGKTQGEAAKDIAGLYNYSMESKTGSDNRAPVKERGPKVDDFKPISVKNGQKRPEISHYKYGPPTMVHVYADKDGVEQYYVCRFELPDGSKQFASYSYGEHKGVIGWHWKAWPKNRLLYNLKALHDKPDAPVVLVEGEKAADAAQKMFEKRVSVTWAGGAQAISKTDWTPLKNRTVMVWPDNDKPGIEAAEKILNILHKQGAGKLYIIKPPEDKPKGWDVADYMQNHTNEEYERLKKCVMDWVPPPPPERKEPKEKASRPTYTATSKAIVSYQGVEQHSGGNDIGENAQDKSYNTHETYPNAEKLEMPEFLPTDQINMKEMGQVVETMPNFTHLKNGRPTSTVDNMAALLAHKKVNIMFNVITKRSEFGIPSETGFKSASETVSESSITWIRSQCVEYGMSTEDYKHNIFYVASKNPRNPILDWIQATPWDGVSRLKQFYDTVDAVNNPLKEKLMYRWMLSAVAAAAEPDGVVAKGVLTFTGAQNVGKTHWFKNLVPPDLRGYIQDGLTVNPSSRDSVKICISKWLIELGELDATFRKADIAALKAFITLQKDIMRLSYGHTEIEMARRTVFFASVNEKNFLYDTTGNTRFWVIDVKKIKYEHGMNMQQVWAEVYTLYLNDESWHLTPQEAKELDISNEVFEAKSDIHNMLTTYYDFSKNCTRWLSATEIALEIGVKNISRGTTTEIGRELRKIYQGDESKFNRSNGKNTILMPQFEKPEIDNGRNATNYTYKNSDFNDY